MESWPLPSLRRRKNFQKRFLKNEKLLEFTHSLRAGIVPGGQVSEGGGWQEKGGERGEPEKEGDESPTLGVGKFNIHLI